MRTIANAARALKLRAARRRPGAAALRALPALLLLTDSERLADPVPVLARLPRGAGVILRDYDGTAGDALRRNKARALARACRLRGLRLFVAGDARLARAIGAFGLHLPEWMVRRQPVAVAPRMRGRLVVTTACHSAAALRRASRFGADAALLAPVLPTASHPGGRVLGPLRFAHLVRTARLPVFALGGIDAEGARRIGGSGAAGIAGIGFAAAAPGRAP